MITYAITPNRHESAWIRYKMELAGTDTSCVARSLGVSQPAVTRVISGLSHSARIEAEIARIIGFGEWNEMLLSLRKGSISMAV